MPRDNNGTRSSSHSGFATPVTSNGKSTDSIRTDSITDRITEQTGEDPEKAITLQLSHVLGEDEVLHQATSTGTTGTNNPAFEVDWDDEPDPLNPNDWPRWYKGVVIGVVSWSTWVVVVYSTSYTTGIARMMHDFNVSSEPVVTLGVTTYLLGLAVGSVILAPLSEMYGRRPVYIASMFAFMVLIIPCGIGTSLAEVLVVRFFGAVAGSAMIANAPGTVSEIVTDEYRALALSIWSIGPLNGPTFGPLIGGFSTQYLGWRWTNWIVMMISAVAWISVSLLKETYPPAILKNKATLRRKETGDERYWSRYDDRKISVVQLLKINLSRPFVMIFTEPICIFWDIYIAIIYGILYLCFIAYPIVFTGLRGWSTGISGLAFAGLAVGCFLVIGSEPLLRQMINSHKVDPETGRVPPEAMVSVICIAAVLVPIGELWFAWTCVPPVHWIWPILAGIPFGAGNTAVFIYASNYLAHSYGIYAASALAGNSIVRSFLGGTLPLAGPAMYEKLNPHWAGTLLGLAQVAIIPIPVVFYKYGHKIRKKSVLIQNMQKDKVKLDGRRAKNIAIRDTKDAGEITAKAETNVA